MPCVVDISDSDASNHFELLLCKACKFLTIEQIETLKNPSGIVDGMYWYTQHLMFDYASSGATEEDKKIALAELNRVGYTLEDDGKGVSLISKSRIKNE